MKRLLVGLLALLVVACIGIGGGVTQTITKALQLSQDASGVFGVDASNNVYFANKILSTRTTTPTLTSCGTAPSIIGNDTVGKLTTGSAATTCTITFSAAYNVAPACVLQTQGSATMPTYTTSTTAITVTVDIASTVYNYICLSQG